VLFLKMSTHSNSLSTPRHGSTITQARARMEADIPSSRVASQQRSNRSRKSRAAVHFGSRADKRCFQPTLARTPSRSSRSRFHFIPAVKPPSWPLVRNTRWQGIRIGIGFAPQALPTARTAFGFQTAVATCA